jgi:glycosyltransferase involved in cell wall biosynthesis
MKRGMTNFFKAALYRGRLWYSDFTRCLEMGKSLNKSTAIVFPSKWVLDISKRHTRMTNPHSFVIPNPIDTELFKTSTKYSLSERKRGLSARSLEWVYGLDIAIKAFSNLKEANLTILGKGELEDYLGKLSQQYNSNVRFITRMIDHGAMADFMNDFGFFIAPSRIESQGVAMCEAMACGMPVVATRAGGIPEFVQDGFNGLLVPIGDYLSLRRAINLLLSKSSLYETFSQNAARFVSDNLSYKKIYQMDCQVFEFARDLL